MTIYQVYRLAVWQGNYFNDSYAYRSLGITTDETLVEILTGPAYKFRTCNYPKDSLPWPLIHMDTWPIYKCKKVLELKQTLNTLLPVPLGLEKLLDNQL